MRSFEVAKIISDYERVQESIKWVNEIPVLHFEKEWDVRIIPPFGGAVIRFWIWHNGKEVSVYFDAYSELGFVYDEDDNPIPYFEYYDGEDTHRYLMNESGKMMEDIKSFLDS